MWYWLIWFIGLDYIASNSGKLVKDNLTRLLQILAPLKIKINHNINFDIVITKALETRMTIGQCVKETGLNPFIHILPVNTRWSATSVKDNRGTGSASIRHESLSSEIERSWGSIFYHSLVIAIISIVKHSFDVIPWYNFHCFIHNHNNVSQLSQWQAPSVTVVNNIPCPKHKVSSQYYHIA